MSLEDHLYPLLKFYDRVPAPVKNLAGRAYRQLPVAWRRGKRFQEFARLAREADRWDREQAARFQLEQVRQMVAHAAASCPYYARRFAAAGFRGDRLESLDQLEGCPFLEKSDLLKSLPEMVSRAIPASQRLYITTGGSSGVPVGFYLQKGVSRTKEQAFFEAMWERAGYFEGARLAVIRGHVTSERQQGPIHSYDATRDWLMLSSYHLTRDRLGEYLERLEKFRPDFLHSYPSAALQLAEYLASSKQTLRVPLKAVLCGSERLTLPQKRLLEQTFACRVFRWYGHSERAILAAEGRMSELYYFYPQYGLVEFGPPDEEGMREVIGTSFHNLAMPLIRYRTGDFVRLAGESRPEKPNEFFWPAAVEVTGREQEYLVSGSGRRISLTAFNMHDDIFDHLYAVQFYQEEPGRAEFRYLPGPHFHHSRLPAIAAGIRRKLGDDFQIELREVKEVEKTARGKHRWVISQIKQGIEEKP